MIESRIERAEPHRARQVLDGNIRVTRKVSEQSAEHPRRGKVAVQLQRPIDETRPASTRQPESTARSRGVRARQHHPCQVQLLAELSARPRASLWREPPSNRCKLARRSTRPHAVCRSIFIIKRNRSREQMQRISGYIQHAFRYLCHSHGGVGFIREHHASNSVPNFCSDPVLLRPDIASRLSWQRRGSPVRDAAHEIGYAGNRHLTKGYP
jgi:hypothetical protein